MRKIFLLFGLMLGFGVCTALAALPTHNVAVSTTGNETTFYIKANASGSSYFWNTSTSPTRTASEYGKFAFYAVSGKTDAYYIKECITNKWLSYDKTAITTDGKGKVTLVDAQENYFIVQKNINYYWIRPLNGNGDATSYCNWHGGPTTFNGETMGLYNSWGDRGSQWILVQTDKVITDVSQIRNNKIYTIASWRCGLSVTDDETTSTARNSGMATENANKWVFFNNGGSNYLYNIESRTFLKDNGSMGAATDAVSVSDWGTSADGIFKFHINVGSNTINCQSSSIVIDSYGSADEGNRMMIVEIDDFDDSNNSALVSLAEAIALYTPKNKILKKVEPLAEFSTYANVIPGIYTATTETEVNTALAGFNNFITLKCRSGKYLKVGTSACSYEENPSGFDHVIKLESAGGGSFYLKGYSSTKYIGDVVISTAISSTDSPTVSFYFQSYNGYTVVRPSDTSSSYDGYRYIHNGGSGCVGWVPSGTNTQHTMVEFGNPDMPAEVTYDQYFNGNKINTQTANTYVGTKTVLPDAFMRDYVENNPDAAFVTADGQTVRIDATWTGPFELNADYASISKWYDMSVRGNWYVTSDQKDGNGALVTVEANAMGLAEDAYQWAFVGSDPWHIKLYNKDQGSTKAYSWVSNDNASVPSFVDVADANNWWIKKSTSSVANSFMLTTNQGYQVNQFGGAGGSLKVWAATGTNDVGSAFTVFDVPDDFSAYAVAEILPYLEASGYYALTDAAKAEIGWDDSYSTSCPFAAYKAMKQALQAKLADGSGVKKPGTGYYRLQSKYYPGKYMSYRIFDDNGTVAHSICAVDNSSDITSIVKLTSLGSNKYTLSMEGAYVPVPKTSTKMELADNPVEFTAISSYFGAAAFNTNNQEENRDRAIHCASTQSYYCVGWTYNAEASEWKLEDATTFSIAMHAGESSYWATLNAPFGVELPDGTEAYVGIKEGNSLVLTSIGTDVPANTPVVLMGNSASITATINDAIPAINKANDLQGQNLSQTDENESLLSLGIYDGVVGFYQYEGIIGANKAYLNNSTGTPSNGFQFVFDDVTGLNNVVNISVDGQLYDLQGRKVVAPAKGGLYIKGGKVVKY